MNRDRDSTDRQDLATEMYKEDIRIDFEKELENMVGDLWGSPRNVDWNQDMDVDETTKRALIDIATQFHFNNMSELSLCGRVLQNEHLLEAKMVSSIIAVSKIRNIGTWSKYLSKHNVATDIPAPEKEYFNRLFDIEDTDSILMGMSVVGKVAWLALTDELEDFGDPVFKQIVEQIRAQKEAKLRITKDYLRKGVEQRNEEELRDLEEDARYYRGHARETILYHRRTLDELGKDTQQIADRVEDKITEFYDDIGLRV